MKKIPLRVLLTTLAGLVAVHSQDASSAMARQPAVPATPARIIGNIPDGTPPPPQAPKPEFVARGTDILVSKVHQQGGRTITIQEINDLYNAEFWRLKTAREGRERARLQHEADLKAHPPQPKNIVVNFWTTDTPAPANRGAVK